jgi:metal-sulfur cluster biosynthetic enzyme
VSDERPVNPHTGQPVPADPAPPAVAARSTAQGGDPAPGASGATPAAPASAAPSQQEMAIRSALETVMDPEINLSVIDLGLIREVQIQPGKTLIRMMLTTPFCPYAPQLMADVKQATQSVVDQECEVEIMPDAWSPDMMPDPGLLGFSY